MSAVPLTGGRHALLYLIPLLDAAAVLVEAFDHESTSGLALGLLLMLASCHKTQPLHAPHASHANEPPDIAWFDGSLEGAFIVAKRENRPVLIYWGAEWCPFCHTLKSTVFSRPDFIAKSKLFLPVYLDGDDDGAQKWGEEFHIQGYPTLIVLDPDRHEIIRLGAGRDVSQYAAALDVALENVQPVDALLKSVVTGGSLKLEECRRLAYNSWELDTLEADSYGAQASALATAASDCPADALLERASLNSYAAYYAANAESQALDQPKAVPSPLLAGLQDHVNDVLPQPTLAVTASGALAMLDDNFFKSVRVRGGALPEQLRDRYSATMAAAATDKRYALADQLEFLDAQLRALKELGKPKTELPKDVVANAHAAHRCRTGGRTESVRAFRSGECIARYPRGPERLAGRLHDCARRDRTRQRAVLLQGRPGRDRREDGPQGRSADPAR